MADSICPVCSALYASPALRNAHLAADHPGTTIAWAGHAATITASDGSTRVLTRRDFRTLREQARQGADSGGGAPVAPDSTVLPAVSSSPAGPSATPPVAPRVTGPVPRITQPTPGRRVVTRATVAEALTEHDLAELLVMVSHALSEADGAGPAGEFSQSEAALIARLLHDQTIDFVIHRFEGDVGRFKAGAALVVIAIGKGRVHLAAISRTGGIRRLGASTRRPTTLEAVPAGLPDVPPMPPVPAPAAPVAPPWASVVTAAQSAEVIGPVTADVGGGFQPMTFEDLGERQRAAHDNGRGPTRIDQTTSGGHPIGGKSVLDDIFGT